jgi:hypothetical protein
MNGYFSEEALLRFAELVAQTEASDFSEGEVYDFTRCVRPNGTAYGTAGECRKGTEKNKAVVPNVNVPKSKPKSKKTKKVLGKTTPKKQVKPVQKTKTAETKVDKPPQLTERHKEIIHKWSENSSSYLWKKVNSCLRNPSACDDKEEVSQFTKELKSAVEALPKNVKGETYYRGLDLEENPEAYKRFKGLKAGDKITDPGFNSYSRSRDTAESFSTFEGEWPSVLIVSKSKKLADISAHSALANEQEALLPPNSSQTVKSVSRMNELIIIEVED